ncbi:hypothetical protein TWF281_001367 [Arthrobotrys megalospora]
MAEWTHRIHARLVSQGLQFTPHAEQTLQLTLAVYKQEFKRFHQIVPWIQLVHVLEHSLVYGISLIAHGKCKPLANRKFRPPRSNDSRLISAILSAILVTMQERSTKALSGE